MKVDLLLKNIGELASPEGTSALRGEEMNNINVKNNVNVGIGGGKVSYIGNDEIEADNVIDIEGRAVIPGFVDCHTHIPFVGSRSNEFLMRLQGSSYMEIMEKGGGIVSTVKEVRKTKKETLIESNLNKLKKMLVHGVTTVEGKSGYGLNKETELKQLTVLNELNKLSKVDVVSTFLGAHALPKEYNDKEKYLIDVLSYIDDVYPLADTVDVFCEKGVFEPEIVEPFLKEFKKKGFRLRLHADELAASGAGKLAVKLGAISADHLISADYETVHSLGKSNTASVILPATSFFLNEKYAPGREMIDENCILGLASDFNPGSSNIFDPLFVIHLATTRCGLTVEEALSAYTVNPSYVLGMEDRKGRIGIQYDADLVILDLCSYREIPYMFSRDVIHGVVKSGEMVTDEC
ncbi:MAG: imidazolonepropionase [Kosmotoga sp.]|nr:MAG: imidazolonepropionase [Kosmotoga sp.]